MFNFSNFRLKSFVPLCLGLILGLLLMTVSSVMAGFSAVVPVVPAATTLASIPAAPSPGTVNGCIGGATNPNRSLSLDGRIITPSTLLRISPNCAPNETALSLSTGGSSSNYVRTIVVSPTPGAPDTTNGTALLNALNSIGTTPAYPAASATNPYLLKIEPGIYNVGSTPFQMKPFVDVEGSGEGVTTILGSLNFTGAGTGTVVAANNTELRFVTVINATTPAANNLAVAIFVGNTDSTARLTHVTAVARGGAGNAAIDLNASSPTLRDVTALTRGTGDATGILSNAASPLIQNLTVDVQGTGNNFGILNLLNCFPTIQSAVITVSGGTKAYGIQSSGSIVTATNLIITASDASNTNYGIYNDNTALNLHSSQVLASGGNISYGLYNQDSSTPRLRPYSLSVFNSHISAKDGSTQSVAVYNGVEVSYTLDHSTLTVQNGGANSNSIGISNTGIITLHNSTIAINNAGNFGYGIYNGSSIYSPIAKIFDSNISLTSQSDGYGLFNLNGSAYLYNSTANATSVQGKSRGIFSRGDAGNNALVVVNGGTVKGATSALQLDSVGGGTQSVAKIGNAQLDGPVTVNGTVTCVGAYNANYTALPPTCT